MIRLVKCESCGKMVSIPQKDNEPIRIVRCPNCSHQLRAVFGSQQTGSKETVYGGWIANNSQPNISDEEGTVYAPHKNVSKGMLKYNGRLYQLHSGNNVIGRKAPTSDADIQIETTDKHMSREHITIKMTRVANGSLKALVSCCKKDLTTIVGSQSISVNDTVVLTNGTTLKLGQSLIVYLEE